MKFWPLILAALLAGCAATSIQQVGPCTKYTAREFWDSATAMVCYGPDGQVIGMVAGRGETAASLWGSAANAAVLSAAIPITATLLAPSQNVTVPGK